MPETDDERRQRERKRYDELIAEDPNINRAYALRQAQQEREPYIEVVPRKTTSTPAKDTPTIRKVFGYPQPKQPKRDEGKGKKESLLRRVVKNMREAEAWKQKHVVGYKPMNLLPGSRQEKPRQAPPSRKAKHKNKMQRIETIDTANRLGISAQEAREYLDYKKPRKSSPKKRARKQPKEEKSFSIFSGSVLGGKKPRSIFG